MANYDSDSSGDEEKDYTETDVLLGYTTKEQKEEIVSRLGGRPEWLAENTAPSAAIARCKNCKDFMVLLLQLNGELKSRFPGHERRIYIFACRKKSCRRKDGSIRALRGVRTAIQDGDDSNKSEDKEKEPMNEPAKPATGLGELLFGVTSMGSAASSAHPFSTSASANPFSSKSSSATANPFSTKPSAPTPSSSSDPAKDLPQTFASALSLNNAQSASSPPPAAELWPAESSLPPAYPVLWISDAEFETLDPTPEPKEPPTTAMDIDDGAGGSGGGKEDKEVFESSMDATFQKFADRVGQNPDQVIRYEFAGQALLYSKDDGVGKMLGGGGKGMPRCNNCGARRVFEVQLTPHAITELEGEEDGLNLDGMDWGTVIVGVCERDCQEKGRGVGKAGYMEEWIGVQWEQLSASR